jgi:prepilin-type N-terminal cleavage/methylation domain-containing protein
VSRQGTWKEERGFTLVEVIVTIIVMGVVLAIATSTWFRMVESRRVDSATNQVVADLRLAHAQATNRLTEASFVVPSADSSSYQVGPPDDLETQNLPRDDQGTPKAKFLTATNFTITFYPEGGAEIDPAGDITVMVASTDGDPTHTIKINPITSRVKIVD